MVIKYIKNIFSKQNLLFVAVSIILSIIGLNLYSKLLTGPVLGWMAIMVVITVTIIGIFVSGWLLGFRKKSIHIIEWMITIVVIIAIMLLLQQYQPAWLFGANAFVEPSREALADISRSVFVK